MFLPIPLRNRKTVWANLHPNLHASYSTTYCSAVGHKTGQKFKWVVAYARTKIEKVICASTSKVMPRSLSILPSPCAIIENNTREMKVKEHTTNVASHCCLLVYSLGFSGSSRPNRIISILASQPHYLRSVSAGPCTPGLSLSRTLRVPPSASSLSSLGCGFCFSKSLFMSLLSGFCSS